MTSRTRSENKPPKTTQALANIGAVVAALWLLAFLVPVAREMMLDMIFSFLLGLIVTGLLWWTAYQGVRPARFWRLLAAAWSIGLLGNIAWGLYEALTGQSLPYISLVDALYLARYVLVFVAFWRVLGIPSGRQWFNLVVALAAAAAVAVGLYYLSLPAVRRPLALYMASAGYAILDVGLVYVALEAWWVEPRSRLRTALGLIALALIAYGGANWINSYGRLISWEAVSGLSALFWPLSDILAGLGVLHLHATRRQDNPEKT